MSTFTLSRARVSFEDMCFGAIHIPAFARPRFNEMVDAFAEYEESRRRRCANIA